MVSVLICSGQLESACFGTLRAQSCPESAEYGAALAAIDEQCSNSGRAAVFTMSVGKFEWMESAPPVAGNRHDGVMGAVKTAHQ